MSDSQNQSVTLLNSKSKINSPAKIYDAEKSKKEREEKIKENTEKLIALHNEKLEKSTTMFKDTKVTSCS